MSSWVGESVLRQEDLALLTGAGRFIDDLEPVGHLAHAAILRSPHGHARIKRIDTRAVEVMPGVIGVVTGSDIARMSKPIGNLFGLQAEYFPCAVDKVRYFGEPVAVVVAKDRYIAEDGIDEISVDYEVLPSVLDPESALLSDAAWLHESLETNIVHHRTFRYGEPDEHFKNADKVISVKTHYPRVMSMPMETYGVIAHFETSPDRYTVWSNFQGPYALHPIMCAALGIEGRRLRLISPPYSGGSFGTKQAVYPYIVLMALVSRKLRVPVKWIEDRLEHIAASSSASDRVVEMQAAFSREGKFQALKVKQLENVGAYLRPPEPAALYRFHATLGGPYKLDHVFLENMAIVTNQVPTGLNRGFGGAQYCFPLERLMNRAALELGIDPIELRRRNFIRKDEFPYQCSSGGLMDSGDYHATLDLALKEIGYPEVLRHSAKAGDESKALGIGIACAIESAGSNLAYVNLGLTPEQREKSLPKSGGSSTSTITLDPLGGIVVRIDGAPNGQGHQTVVAQVVASEIGVRPEDIEVVTTLDTLTDAWSVSSGNYANRFSTIVIDAVASAAAKVAQKLKEIAAESLGVPADSIVLEGGAAIARSGRNVSIPIRRLAAKSHWDTGGLPAGVSAGIYESATLTQPGKDVDAEDRLRASLTYSFQCDVAVVEVDKRTGVVRILNYVSAHDCGRLLNPKIAEGQIWGGFVHGLGAAMSESIKYASDGTLLTTTLVDYLCPTANDIPPFKIGHTVSPSPFTRFGSKGLGDGCSMVVPAVIANALEDALGLENPIPPFNPNDVWQACNPDLSEQDRQGKQGTPRRIDAKGVEVRGEGEIAVAAAPARVWQNLFDTDVIQRLLPGCEELSESERDCYEATVKISVAGIGGRYDARIQVYDKVEASSATLHFSVNGRLGHGEGIADISLVPHEEGTKLSFGYQGAVGGRIAGVGNRVLSGVVRVLISRFFEGLNRELQPQPYGSAKIGAGVIGRTLSRLRSRLLR